MGTRPAADLESQREAATLYAKVARNEPLTVAEKAALKRFEREREEQLRWKFYESIPQKHWRQMSGRQTKVLNEQAQRYQLPVGGPTIHLPTLARALHDFLAANAQRLASEDRLLEGTGSPALEAYRQERAALAKLDRREREQQLLPRDQVREALSRIAATIRTAGATLGRRFGEEAVDILLEALDDAQADIERFFPQRPHDIVDEPLSAAD